MSSVGDSQLRERNERLALRRQKRYARRWQEMAILALMVLIFAILSGGSAVAQDATIPDGLAINNNNE